MYHFEAQVVREAPGRFTCNANTNKNNKTNKNIWSEFSNSPALRFLTRIRLYSYSILRLNSLGRAAVLARADAFI